MKCNPVSQEQEKILDLCIMVWNLILFVVEKGWGGLPISGVIGKKELLDLPDTGSMSSTHSANPLVCEAGNAVMTR